LGIVTLTDQYFSEGWLNHQPENMEVKEKKGFNQQKIGFSQQKIRAFHQKKCI